MKYHISSKLGVLDENEVKEIPIAFFFQRITRDISWRRKARASQLDKAKTML